MVITVDEMGKEQKHCSCDRSRISIYNETAKYWELVYGNGEPFFIIAQYIPPGYGDSKNEVGYCPKCGDRLGFRGDGTSIVN